MINDQINARQRRETISQRVMRDGSIQITDLMEEFGLTDTSIRRDLSILERRGMVRRVRGGAISTSKAFQVADLERRMKLYGAEKQCIGAKAIDYIQAQDVLLLDSGTSVLQMTRCIPMSFRRQGVLRMVTNSTILVDEVGEWAAPNLLLLGGIYLPEHRATVGPQLLEQLSTISANRAFLGCDGLSIEGGITTAHPLIAEAGRMMAERAEQVIVLADRSKLGRVGFVPIIPITQIDVLISDRDAPDDVVTKLRSRGVEVALV
jgi:DeoR family fructose operon transcriptional repressor